MRYFYEKPSVYRVSRGRTYKCDHELYDTCTLYEIGFCGLAVIQQRWDPEHKITYWGAIDPWLVDDIYNHPGFKVLFGNFARPPERLLFPTLTVRQVMSALKMKPLPKQRWETVFDHKPL